MISLKFAVENLEKQREQSLMNGETENGLVDTLTRMITTLEHAINRIPFTFGDEPLEHLQRQTCFDARDTMSAWLSQQEGSASQVQAMTDQTLSQGTTADVETTPVIPASQEPAKVEQATLATSEDSACNTTRHSATSHGRARRSSLICAMCLCTLHILSSDLSIPD